MKSKNVYWVKYHLEHLRNWRLAANLIAKVAKDIRDNVEVYVIGGAAEGRLTILSDIDVLICINEPISEKEIAELRKRILIKAMDEYGLPWDYPVELHIHTKCECERLLKRLKKFIKVT